MPSKINGVDGSRSTSSATGRVAARAAKAASGSAPAGDATADVHITDAASQLAALEQAVRDLPAVDEARVAPLRSAIDQGTYRVSGEQVADRLLQFEQALNPSR